MEKCCLACLMCPLVGSMYPLVCKIYPLVCIMYSIYKVRRLVQVSTDNVGTASRLYLLIPMLLYCIHKNGCQGVSVQSIKCQPQEHEDVESPAPCKGGQSSTPYNLNSKALPETVGSLERLLFSSQKISVSLREPVLKHKEDLQSLRAYIQLHKVHLCTSRTICCPRGQNPLGEEWAFSPYSLQSLRNLQPIGRT